MTNTKFYSVQIPYRGIIPILMRRGPITSVELTIEQVNTMLENKVPLLDPNNGKELSFLDFDENRKEANATSAKEEKKPDSSKKETDEKVADPTPEPPINATAKAETSEKPSEKTEVAPTDASTEDAISTDEEDETDTATDNSGFDFTKIRNYSTLSRSKKKAIRERFAKLKAQGMDINIIYATLNSEANKQ